MIKFAKALRISWIKRVLNHEYTAWNLIHTLDVEREVFLYTEGYVNPESISKIKNPFWKEVFLAWNEFLNKSKDIMHPFTIKNESLWKNANCKDKSNFFPKCYQAVVRSIRDILGQITEFKTFQEIQRTYMIDGNVTAYSNS